MEWGGFFSAISESWVSLMGGIASVILSFIGAFYSWRGETIPARALWIAALICFLVAAVKIWTVEHRKYFAEVEKGHSPKISITVHQISTALMLIEGKSEAVFILTILSVRNTGAPSIVDTWLMTMNDPKIKITKITVAEDLQWPYTNGIYTFSKNDYIHKKTAEQPVLAGGKKVGFMLWRVEGLGHKSIIDDKGQLSKLTITARDVNGTLITATIKALSINSDDLGDYYPGMEGP